MHLFSSPCFYNPICSASLCFILIPLLYLQVTICALLLFFSSNYFFWNQTLKRRTKLSFSFRKFWRYWNIQLQVQFSFYHQISIFCTFTSFHGFLMFIFQEINSCNELESRSYAHSRFFKRTGIKPIFSAAEC